MTDLPIVVTSAGAQPQNPAAILAALISSVAATVPGYTARLPGSLIEDVSSTEVAGIAECDAAAVELLNSISPLTMNAFLLLQFGQMVGVSQAPATNTSVFVVFSGPPGQVVAKGFTVSDGTYQYVVQDGGVIGSGGTSDPLFAVAVLSGSWAVPAGTVQQFVTSVPSSWTSPAVNNPQTGIPGGSAQSEENYRAIVLQAMQASAQGMATFLKTQIAKVTGVQSRLVSVVQVGSAFEVIVGGGDPYKIAYAIYSGDFDFPSLIGSTINVTGITKANPGVMTFDKNHGYATGQAFSVSGVLGMVAINSVPLTATVVDEKTVSVGVNTTGYGAYVSGGVLAPNLRNISVTLQDFPDTYLIEFVNPPQQTVSIAVLWNTTATNFVSSSTVAQLGTPAIIDYINNLVVGQPINLFELQAVFQAAIADVLPPQLLTRMVFTVSINGVVTAPAAGTGVISGDSESFFECTSASITIAQG